MEYTIKPITAVFLGSLAGSLLLFGAWDANTTIVGFVAAAIIATYLVRHEFPSSVWDS